ncbi:MAG: hypothetical protein C5S41_02025 [Candidatus Methanomarinus sp.]|nr:MAG: hypothetical protein C5S41_02025 [ANME-2 cluster archaeon]
MQARKRKKEGELVSDVEKRAMEQQAVANASGQQNVQNLAAQKASMAMTGGSPIAAGEMRKSAQQIGEASRDAAIKASGQTKKLTAALSAARRGDRLDEQIRQDAINAQTFEQLLQVGEVVGAELSDM